MFLKNSHSRKIRFSFLVSDRESFKYSYVCYYAFLINSLITY